MTRYRLVVKGSDKIAATALRDNVRKLLEGTTASILASHTTALNEAVLDVEFANDDRVVVEGFLKTWADAAARRDDLLHQDSGWKSPTYPPYPVGALLFWNRG